MKNRDRIIATLTGRAADRAPFGVGLGFWGWGETLPRWRAESGIADLDTAAYFGYDRGFAVAPLQYGPLPHFAEKVIREDGEFVVSTDWRGITVRNRRDYASMPEFLDHPIKTPDDWRRYKAERIQPRLAERLAGLDKFIAEMAAVDAPVQFGTFPWGAFGTARDLLGAEQLLVAFYDEPAMVHDIIETHVDLWVAMMELVQQRIGIDHIHIWEDMSGRQGSLISMAMVEEFMMPGYDRIAACARRRGVPVISVDSDGRVDELVACMTRHGINAFLPFEVQAGNDIEQFRRDFPRLGIIGGLDKNALSLSRKEINRELDKAERMLAAGGYIPGCDHLIPPNVSWDNWKYFNVQLKKLIGA